MIILRFEEKLLRNIVFLLMLYLGIIGKLKNVFLIIFKHCFLIYTSLFVYFSYSFQNRLTIGQC